MATGGHLPTMPPYETSRADDVASRIEEQVEASGSSPDSRAPLYWVHGGDEVLRERVLARLARVRPGLRFTPVHLTLPELGVDAASHLAVQVAGALRGVNVREGLDLVFSCKVPPSDKEETLLRTLRERPIWLLISLPNSWSDRRGQPPGLGSLWKRASGLLQRLLGLNCPTVIAAEAPCTWLEGWERVQRFELIPDLEDPASSLEEPRRWRALEPYARRLRESLTESSPRAPASLRLGVSLVAMGAAGSEVAVEWLHGVDRLCMLAGQRLRERHEPLVRALSKVSFCRFPVARQTLGELVGQEAPEGSRERALLEVAFLQESEQGWSLPPITRRILHSLRDRRALLEEQERVQVHRHLSHAYWADWRGDWQINDRRSAIRAMEAVHHAAAAAEREQVMRCALDVTQLWELGRALSRQRRFSDAADVLREAVKHTPDEVYAKESLALALEQAGHAPTEVERLYQEAYESEPAEPGYIRRYIEFLLSRGKLKAAHTAWLDSLSRLMGKESPADERRSEWLARHFHAAIARGFLERGGLRYARDVLEMTPALLRESDVELQRAWEQLLHREEAETLGGAVFPESIPFQVRWSGGPWLVRSREQRERLQAWYPGRLVEADEQGVILELAEPPAEGQSLPALFRSEMGGRDFLRAARLEGLHEVTPGQFLEVLILGDEETVIELHPLPSSWPRPALGLLRRWRPPQPEENSLD